MKRRIGLVLLLGILLAILAPYVLRHREARTLDAPTRAALGGDYVTLSSGVTHYELSGPADAPVVVLVHGATVPLFAWDAQMPALLDAGFRVLRYDQFGRGYSDRPAVQYDRALYQKQLEDLLTALEIEGPINVVGASFGSAMAATFARNHPARVERLIFIAPLLDYAEGKPQFGLAKIPAFGEWYARVFGVRGAVARANGFFQESGADPSYAERFDEQTRFEGFERSLLSMSRTDALTSYRDTYAALADQPKLLLWGSEDGEMPREHMEQIRLSSPNVLLIEIEGAGHGVNVERKEEVNRRIVEFLRRPTTDH